MFPLLLLKIIKKEANVRKSGYNAIEKISVLKETKKQVINGKSEKDGTIFIIEIRKRGLV